MQDLQQSISTLRYYSLYCDEGSRPSSRLRSFTLFWTCANDFSLSAPASRRSAQTRSSSRLMVKPLNKTCTSVSITLLPFLSCFCAFPSCSPLNPAAPDFHPTAAARQVGKIHRPKRNEPRGVAPLRAPLRFLLSRRRRELRAMPPSSEVFPGKSKSRGTAPCSRGRSSPHSGISVRWEAGIRSAPWLQPSARFQLRSWHQRGVELPDGCSLQQRRCFLRFLTLSGHPRTKKQQRNNKQWNTVNICGPTSRLCYQCPPTSQHFK